MATFILQNQHGQFFNREKEWVNGSDAVSLFHSPHYDVALNQLIEANAKDHTLRGVVISCELDGKGRPALQPAETSQLADHATDELSPGNTVEPASESTTEESNTTAAHA